MLSSGTTESCRVKKNNHGGPFLSQQLLLVLFTLRKDVVSSLVHKLPCLMSAIGELYDVIMIASVSTILGTPL